MTTPVPSRRSSEDIKSMSPSTMQQNRNPISVCHSDTNYSLPIRNSIADVNLARDAYNVASPYPRVLVNDLLNSAPISENQYSNENRTSNVHNASVNLNVLGRARTISSTSAMSISSSVTLQPPFSIAEERMLLIVRLYYTCWDASTSYIHSLPPIRRHPDIALSYIRSRRHHPYAQNSRPGQQARHRTVGRSRNLMDNISAICTHIWRRARSDALAPHREEAEAVRAMRDLYAWGEIITKGFQGDDLEDAECRSAMGSLSSSAGNDVWARVGEAAQNLCQWLGDNVALGICERLVDELGDLKER
jgi:hypothetical protein